MSIQLKLINLMMRMLGPAMGPDFDVDKLRKQSQQPGQLPYEKSVHWASEVLAGREVYVAAPENAREDALILHIHGGAFVSGSAKYARTFTSSLAKMARMKVYSIDYRLAPEHPFPAGVNDCFEQYVALREQFPHQQVALVGESAGATLVIVVALMARDRGVSLPACVVAYAPCGYVTDEVNRPRRTTDFAIAHAALKRVNQFYCPQDAKNPYASPCLAEYHAFPPLRIVWDVGEQLAFDSAILAEKAKQAGVLVEAAAYRGTFHTFAALGNLLPEARQEIQASGKFIENQLSLQRQAGLPAVTGKL